MAETDDTARRVLLERVNKLNTHAEPGERYWTVVVLYNDVIYHQLPNGETSLYDSKPNVLSHETAKTGAWSEATKRAIEALEWLYHTYVHVEGHRYPFEEIGRYYGKGHSVTFDAFRNKVDRLLKRKTPKSVSNREWLEKLLAEKPEVSK